MKRVRESLYESIDDEISNSFEEETGEEFDSEDANNLEYEDESDSEPEIDWKEDDAEAYTSIGSKDKERFSFGPAEDIDVSDMSDVDTIDVEDNDEFNDELLKALNNELKSPEFNRRTAKFRLKSDPAIYTGIVLAKLGENSFLFKLSDGSKKKILIDDMKLVEELKHTYNRAKSVNEKN